MRRKRSHGTPRGVRCARFILLRDLTQLLFKLLIAVLQLLDRACHDAELPLKCFDPHQ